MWYAITIIFILIICFLMLRLRFRVELNSTRRLIFFGVGRSGVQVDYIANVSRIRLFGMTIRTISRVDTEEDTEKAIRVTATKISKGKREEERPGKRRALHIREWIDIGLTSWRAVRKYIVGLFRAVIVEEAEAEIRGGFESPNLTGEVYGYYQALIGAVPSLAPRLRFYPDWMGKSFDGSARLSLAIPIYSLAYRTGLMIFRLPIVRTYRLVREQRKGAVYVK